IELVTPFPLSVNIRKDDFFQQINQRKIENGLIKKSGDCQVFKNGNRTQAYEFVKKLLQKHSQDIKEICLWDPYLTASDIIETLYFENTGKPFRCITSLGKAKQIDKKNQLDETTRKDIDFKQFKKDQLVYFQKHSNNLRVHLDFRCQHADYGAPFHDRFLIFIPNDAHDLPKTYSLGTSVNTLGQKHHIIQKTADARLILQNFNELWDSLSPDACRIVLFPKDLQ
ncbi:MAG: VPA1262 family N-terminal domain-containing protein, partial [Fibrobacteraceae bacterium]